MRQLLPYALMICCGLPLLAHAGPDTTIYITRDTPLARTPVIRLEWQLLVNGMPSQKGVLPVVTLSARHPTPVNVPAKWPAGNDELTLRLIFRRPSPATGRARGNPLFTRQILVRPWKGDYAIPPTGDLSFTDSNDIFTITSANAIFRFDKQTGWLLHYEVNHLVLVDDSAGLRPSLWPADSTVPHLQLFSTSTGSQLVIVRSEYTLPEVSCLLHMSYTMNASGEMLVGQSLEADSTRQSPALPSFGMNWTLPARLDSVAGYGPPADSSWPDIFHASVATTPTTPIRWMAFYGGDKKGIRITADSNFLVLRTSANRLELQRPMPHYPLPYGNYQYCYKVSPVLPASPRVAKRF
ncbi:MAG TPA: hypothetical protein VHE54_00070 [Puia sp.]|nr:hypothetical protein [Puia sp.]